MISLYLFEDTSFSISNSWSSVTLSLDNSPLSSGINIYTEYITCFSFFRTQDILLPIITRRHVIEDQEADNDSRTKTISDLFCRFR